MHAYVSDQVLHDQQYLDGYDLAAIQLLTGIRLPRCQIVDVWIIAADVGLLPYILCLSEWIGGVGIEDWLLYIKK